MPGEHGVFLKWIISLNVWEFLLLIYNLHVALTPSKCQSNTRDNKNTFIKTRNEGNIPI